MSSLRRQEEPDPFGALLSLGLSFQIVQDRELLGEWLRPRRGEPYSEWSARVDRADYLIEELRTFWDEDRKK